MFEVCFNKLFVYFKAMYNEKTLKRLKKYFANIKGTGFSTTGSKQSVANIL